MFVDLGRLRAFKGSQRYAIPAGLDLAKFQSVIVWCEQFSVLISPADLTLPRLQRPPAEKLEKRPRGDLVTARGSRCNPHRGERAEVGRASDGRSARQRLATCRVA